MVPKYQHLMLSGVFPDKFTGIEFTDEAIVPCDVPQ